MKKYILLLMLMTLLVVFCSCEKSSEYENVLERLDALEKQVAELNEKIGNSESVDAIIPEATLELTPEFTPESTHEPTMKLSYETLSEILGKSNVMAGLDETFSCGNIWINENEYFIYLTYNTTFTDETVETINKNLLDSYGIEFTGKDEGAVADGDFISFSEFEDGTIGLGFELSSIETASKINELNQDYFSSYDDYGISQNVIDESNLPAPTHTINFEKDGSTTLSLNWMTFTQKTGQIKKSEILI